MDINVHLLYGSLGNEIQVFFKNDVQNWPQAKEEKIKLPTFKKFSESSSVKQLNAIPNKWIFNKFKIGKKIVCCMCS